MHPSILMSLVAWSVPTRPWGSRGRLYSSSSSYVALQLFYGVLAFSTNSFHLLLYWARVFQFGTFNFCISFLTSSTQRVFGLPIGLLEMGFQEYILPLPFSYLASFRCDRASSDSEITQMKKVLSIKSDLKGVFRIIF